MTHVQSVKSGAERTVRAAFALLAFAVVFTAASGCSPSRTCGDGTVEQDGACVPVDAGASPCGPGTTLNGGACVAIDAGTGCGPGTILEDGVCVPDPSDAGAICVPDCLARACGDDGCGGSCGTCDDPAAPNCNTATGQCESVCVPQCAGKGCGADGCGGTCGTCPNSTTCQSDGRCLADGWTCDPTHYSDGTVCDCGCGAPDPDCARGLPESGCNEGEVCSAAGACVARVPAAWTCEPTTYDTNDGCDCGCGAPDPDCEVPDAFVSGCGPGVTTCNADGTCGTCTPDCAGKTCGGDGCGGSCGTCDLDAGEDCFAGTCESVCSPTPRICATNTCGDDRCGGTCGTCAAGSTCEGGTCVMDVTDVPNNSCRGRCGTAAPAGCYCDDGCAAAGNCCPDMAAECGCTPDCTGKQCGSDGCGGSCGTCSGDTPVCGADQQCTDTCVPQCEGRSCGDDGCGGTCGTCTGATSCVWTGQCVPDAWDCDPVLYQDQQGCDCGCGAADPDCAEASTSVFGCPGTDPSCSAEGICAITFCHANADCAPGQWCTGVFQENDTRFGGFCATPTVGGRAPGTACTIHEQCASGACVGGQCRLHCTADGQCPDNNVCLGLTVRDPVTRALRGSVGVCDLVYGSGDACASQASCPAGETCIVVTDPGTLGPRHVCSALAVPGAAGQSCEDSACPAGYRCESTTQGRVCALPCPGGAADCATGTTCQNVPFAAQQSGGPEVSLCLP